MSAVPTFAELESAGADAGSLLDATEAELERAIPMARNPADRSYFADQVKRVRQQRARWFGGEA
jgi:hypothetical protein